MNALPTYQHIEAARERLAGQAVRTRLIENETLNAIAGRRVLLKPEVLQRTGSFKFRGAYNRITELQDENPGAPVVAFSSGNHAQGVASAARSHGIGATIVMPSNAPAIKQARTRALGADVVLFDRDTEDRDEISQRIVEAKGAVLVPPFDDAGVIAGQGTVGLEIAEDCDELSVTPAKILVPCGGGGLIAGIALALENLMPEADLHPVEPEDFDDYRRSLESGSLQRNRKFSGSVCDAILVPEPGKITFAINQPRLAGGLTVSDEEALGAVAFASRELKLVVEPGGAVALAAILAGKIEPADEPVVAVLSGGNIDPEILARALAEQDGLFQSA